MADTLSGTRWQLAFLQRSTTLSMAMQPDQYAALVFRSWTTAAASGVGEGECDRAGRADPLIDYAADARCVPLAPARRRSRARYWRALSAVTVDGPLRRGATRTLDVSSLAASPVFAACQAV